MIFDKILFKNNKAPYISDTNLNKMQDNIKKSIEEVDTKTSNLAGNIESEDISNQIISNSNFTIVSNYCKKILNFVNLNLTFKIVKSQTGYNTLAKINSDDLKPVGGITFQAQFSGMVKNLSGAIRGSGDIDIYIPENFEIPADSEIRMNVSYISGIAGSGSEQSEKPYYLKSETYTKNEIDKMNESQNSDISYLEDKTENIEARQLEGHDEIINILNLKNSSVDTAMLSNANTYATRSGFTTTDFVKVNVGDKIFVDYKMPINLFSFVCFDKDKNIINKLKTLSDWTKFGVYVVEENVSYIKFTIQTSQIGIYGVYLNAEEAPANFMEYGKSHLDWLKINENNIDNNSVIEEKLDEKLQKKIARAEQIEKQIPTAETEIAETVTLIDSADLGAEISIFGNLKQEIREGYNLINLEDLSQTEKNGLTYSVSNNVLYLNGTVTATTEIMLLIKETILNGSYVHQIFANFTPTANINNNFKVSQGTAGIGNINLKSAKKVNFSVNDDTNIAFLYLQILPQTIANGQIKYQLVSGTEEKDFEEYGKAPSPEYPAEIEIVKDNIKIVKRNKNCLYVPDYTLKYNGVTSECKNGIINVSGTLNTTWFYLTNFIDCFIKKGNYKFSFNKELPRAEFKVKYKNNKTTTFAFENKKAVNVNLSQDATGYQIALAHLTANEEYTNSDLTFQLEIGDNETEHEINLKDNTLLLPIQKEFGKVNNYQDYFIKKDDNKWYERHPICHKIFDGTETWIKSSSINTLSRFICTEIKNNVGNELIAYCNRFVNENNNNKIGVFWLDKSTNIAYRGRLIINYSDNSEVTLEDFKNKLSEWNEAGNPLCLYYVLATPEDIECTNEQSEILEQLQNIETDKGTNIITTDTIAEVKAKYYKDLKTLFKKAGVL